jgi:hypothetical protein
VERTGASSKTNTGDNNMKRKREEQQVAENAKKLKKRIAGIRKHDVMIARKALSREIEAHQEEAEPCEPSYSISQPS